MTHGVHPHLPPLPPPVATAAAAAQAPAPLVWILATSGRWHCPALSLSPGQPEGESDLGTALYAAHMAPDFRVTFDRQLGT